MISGDIVSILVILARLLAPFAIFRWPLAGILLAIAADASDVMIFEVTGYGFFDGIYHRLDKILDIYYLFFAWLVARRWDDLLARRTAAILFWWRAFGVAIFEATGFRPLFLFAPSIFENFYLFRVIAVKVRPSFTFTVRSLVLVLLAVGIPKLVPRSTSCTFASLTRFGPSSATSSCGGSTSREFLNSCGTMAASRA